MCFKMSSGYYCSDERFKRYKFMYINLSHDSEVFKWAIRLKMINGDISYWILLSSIIKNTKEN